MKKSISLILVTFIMSSTTAIAAGLHRAGYVSIQPNQSINASMNVRYNPDISGSPFIQVIGAGSTITISGRDHEGDTFACHILPTSSLYQTAVDVKNNAQNGAFVFASKDLNSNLCNYIVFGNDSALQD